MGQALTLLAFFTAVMLMQMVEELACRCYGWRRCGNYSSGKRKRGVLNQRLRQAAEMGIDAELSCMHALSVPEGACMGQVPKGFPI